MNDKLQHLLVAVLISIIVLIASHIWFPLEANLDLGLAAFVSFIFVVAKEIIWDKWFKLGTPELMDFFWGITGAIVGPALWLIGEMVLGISEPLPNWM